MTTVCANCGPIPKQYESFVNSNGNLQVGDAFGMEALWVLDNVCLTNEPDYPEDGWSLQQIVEDSLSVGCCRCGNDESSIYGLCDSCQELERLEP